MTRHAPLRGSGRLRTCVGLLSLLFALDTATAQQSRGPQPGTDSVTIVASDHYEAGSLHRWLLGDDHRDLWATPIRVPVLDLRTFAGGLKPEKLGGGNSTWSLHFDAPDGTEYVFRSVDKDPRNHPGDLDHWRLARWVLRDQVAAKHPAANLIFEPFFEAIDVLHDDNGTLYVMPDDPLLGEYREVMAGRLGVLSLFPSKSPESVAKFGVVAILDTDSLVARLNHIPTEWFEPAPYLRARLVDMLLNNWDRHTGNWKWARPTTAGAWVPIARDMDNVLVNHHGVLINAAQIVLPKVVSFDRVYPSMHALTYNAGDLDRRILAWTSRAEFDSTARWLQGTITDELIARAMDRMPPEYADSRRSVGAKLRMRRDSLPAIAERFYEAINAFVTLHGTDGDERATITRAGPGLVDVRLEGPVGAPTRSRRFDASETSEIRLYLHDGDDEAVIRGDVATSIPIRVIGGNGTNRLTDSSRVGGKAHVAGLYDTGETDGVEYVADTLLDRRPVVTTVNEPIHPGRDHGLGAGPILDIGTSRDLGFTPKLGWAWTSYGFRKYPYADRVAVEGRYSMRNRAYSVALHTDHRLESSRIHFTTLARLSQLEQFNWYGLGNNTPPTPGVAIGTRAPRDGVHAVHQDQWLFQPAIAYDIGPATGVSFGPVVQYTISDGPPGGFLELTSPYGSGTFGQAGLGLEFRHDTRDRPSHARRGLMVDARAEGYPAVWDAEGAFGSVEVRTGVYVTLPLPLRPYVGLQLGGRKVMGDFPFHESAFLGGSGGVRILDPQRYAGDLSAAAKATLRVPLFSVNLALPLQVGVFVEQDVGRVWVDGLSQGGWHDAFSTGAWIMFRDISVSLRLYQSNEVGLPPQPQVGVGGALRMP